MEEKSLLENPHISWHDKNIRWIALVLACLFQMGNYFCYDFPAVLQEQIIEDFHVTSVQQNLLYSVYSFPNIILPLAGGFIIDFIGIRTGLVVFYSLLVIGQGLCLLGAVLDKYYLLIIGRVVYGLGGENCSVVQSTIVSKWFQGKEIAFALGLNITMARIGTIMNTTLTPIFYEVNNSFILPLFVGVLFLCFSWATGIILAILDKKSDENDKQILEAKLEDTEKISLSDVKEFKMDLWLVVISCMLSYINLFVFEQNNISMFQQFYSISKRTAETMYNIPYYMGALFTPFMGIGIDVVGRRPLFLIISAVLICFVDGWYLLMPTTSSPNYLYPIVGQAALGLFYSFYAAVLWPCVPMTVPDRAVGTAFGVTNSIQNFGLFLGPLIVGVLITNQDVAGYREMMGFFLGIAAIALLTNIILQIYDIKKNKGKLGRRLKIGKRSSIHPVAGGGAILINDNASRENESTEQ